MLSFLATIIVAVLSLVGINIQTKSQEKQTNILDKLEAFRKESKAEDDKLKELVKASSLSSLKCWLVGELTKIKSGHLIPTEEMKAVIHEAHDRYNKLGGDSYVDDLFDELRHKGLL